MYENSSEILSVEEVAELLYIGRNTVYKLLASGEISAFRIGRVWKIPRNGIEEYILKACRR